MLLNNAVSAAVGLVPFVGDIVQKKAEDLAKHYLDSALNGQGDYKIVSIGKIEAVSISNEKSKIQIKGWSIPITYQGNNAYGIYERHKVQINIDTGFSKIISVK